MVSHVPGNIVLALCASNIFTLMAAAQSVKLLHGGQKSLSRRLAIVPEQPPSEVVLQGVWRNAVYVPRHVEEQFKVVSRGFEVMHVHYPQLAGVHVMGSQCDVPIVIPQLSATSFAPGMR